jgi:hypothetical protein
VGSLRSLRSKSYIDKKSGTSDFLGDLTVSIREALVTKFGHSFSIKQYCFKGAPGRFRSRTCIRYHHGKHDPPIEEVYKSIQGVLESKEISDVKPHIFRRHSPSSSYIDIC